ncbi:hypothetical protein MHLP_01300 [Candidatus Mycoplasma haematolamae str. Purdue]|uniref:Uncharacterized protein n=1 Tax=Mycoplasma haematolamae (strain Purdue) TaxID=1212765 RepID=I7B985_MYCHA|nr:hypothetical protein [Candidatus Mycoplasma haematolamae]AFO51840.1 hypothetical protein MHLP_01300 [Candidatus Mycoplasma haematolamae str. Purdue]
MFKQVALSFTGLGAIGGIGTVSGFYSQSALEWVSDLLEKGSGVTYTINANEPIETKNLTCEGKTGQYPSLKLETDNSGYDLKARLSCQYTSVRQNTSSSPLTTTLDGKNLNCTKDNVSGTTFKCVYEGTTTQENRKIDLNLEDKEPKSITITLKK